MNGDIRLVTSVMFDNCSWVRVYEDGIHIPLTMLINFVDNNPLYTDFFQE